MHVSFKLNPAVRFAGQGPTRSGSLVVQDTKLMDTIRDLFKTFPPQAGIMRFIDTDKEEVVALMRPKALRKDLIQVSSGSDPKTVYTLDQTGKVLEKVTQGYQWTQHPLTPQVLTEVEDILKAMASVRTAGTIDTL